MGTVALLIQRVMLYLSEAYARIHAFFATDTSLHTSRFARLFELGHLLEPTPAPDGLLLGTTHHHFVTVRAQPARRELGNMLVVGPTRSGKG